MRRVIWLKALLASLLALGALLAAASVRADGGFPDVRQVLLPAERPRQIILATNFGLIFSEDSGETWLFSCEQRLGAYAGSYLLAERAAPRLLAVTGSGLIHSDDDSCSWEPTRGGLTNVLIYTVAIDPADSERVYVVGLPRDSAHGSESIYVSDDGGLTFGEPVFTAPERSALLGVLPAPGLPGTLFAAMFSSPENHPILLRSDDRGQSWQVVADLAASLGENPFELLAVDAKDHEKLFVRVLGPASEALAISHDGGLSFVEAVAIPGKLKAFLQLASGTLLLGGTAGTTAIAYRSQDGGRTFEAWPEAPHVHAMAERGGKLYVATDNFLDGYAIGESDDEGLNIEPLAGFQDVSAVKGCVSSVCADSCAYQAGINLWPEAVCGVQSEPAEPGNAVGGAATTDSGPDDEIAGAPGARPTTDDEASGPDEAAPSPRLRALGGGCACEVAAGGPAASWSWLWLALALVRVARRAAPRRQAPRSVWSRRRRQARPLSAPVVKVLSGPLPKLSVSTPKA